MVTPVLKYNVLKIIFQNPAITRKGIASYLKKEVKSIDMCLRTIRNYNYVNRTKTPPEIHQITREKLLYKGKKSKVYRYTITEGGKRYLNYYKQIFNDTSF
jgi:hypothetical protein